MVIREKQGQFAIEYSGGPLGRFRNGTTYVLASTIDRALALFRAAESPEDNLTIHAIRRVGNTNTVIVDDE